LPRSAERRKPPSNRPKRPNKRRTRTHEKTPPDNIRLHLPAARPHVNPGKTHTLTAETVKLMIGDHGE
jgi:hypothetical protein